MARDDADDGRRDAPWDFDLPDLGASTTPEHHRRRRRGEQQEAPQAPSETRSQPRTGPQPQHGTQSPQRRTGRRRPSEDPLDFEALDDDPIDQDDDHLIPHSAEELSTLSPGQRGPELPEQLPDDDVPDDFGAPQPRSSDRRGPAGARTSAGAASSASAASSAGAGARSSRGASASDDDLLPAWATGKPARRRPGGSAAGTDSTREQAAPGDAREHQRRAHSEHVEEPGGRDRGRDDRRRPTGRQHGLPAGGDDHDRRRHEGYDRRADRDAWDDEHGYPDDWDGQRGYPEDWDDDEDWEDSREARQPRWRSWIGDPQRLTRLLVPAAVVLLLIAVGIWSVNALTGGSETDEDPDAVSTEAAQSEDPFDGFSARPKDETTDGASGPAAQACGDALKITGSTDHETYAENADPILIMTIENTGEEPCMVNAGTARMDFTVTSGSDTVFDSKHCQIDGQDRPIELKAGGKESARMQWNRQRSAEGCAEDLEDAAAGGYELEVSLGEDSAEPVEFTLK